ncbi:MAG: hypothetical protein M3P48_10820 [Actinomycetota bacterium]|nr:hypothetical protein [Actinomycetota bacterium]
MQEVIEAEGELGAFRSFQRQPAQRERPLERQLWRFLGTRSGRKIHYAARLTAELDLARVPVPLDAALAHVRPRA